MTLPTGDDVAAARLNIQGFALRTPLLKLAADIELGAKVIRLPFDDWWKVLTGRRFPAVSPAELGP